MPTIDKLKRSLIRKEFKVFSQYAFTTLNAGEQLSDDPYVNVVCSRLANIVDGDGTHLIINLPPRHAKTLLTSVCFAAWRLGHNPSLQIMVVCYGEELARYISYRGRQLLEAPWFKASFACRVSANRSRVDDFQTTKGGGLFATPIGGSITGRGADIIIVDDSNKIEDARYPDRLERTCWLFDTAVRSRANNAAGTIIIVVAHRIHKDDLSGHLLDEGDWDHLVLPLVAERSVTIHHDYGIWRRREGEPLRRAAYPPREIERLRATAGFQLLYQQDTSATTFALEESDFPLFSGTPAKEVAVVMSVDTAHALGDSNSFSVVQLWRNSKGRFYLLDQWRDRVEPELLLSQIRRWIGKYRTPVVLIEDAGIAPMLASRVRKKFGDVVKVELISPGRLSKEDRFQAVLPLLKSRSIWLPENALWRPLWIDELITFPDGDTDDQVDATTQYLSWARKNPIVPALPPPCYGVVVTRQSFLSSGSPFRKPTGGFVS